MQNALKTENDQLRQQLKSLLDEARLNEKKWRRLDQLEKQLIATRTLPMLLDVLLKNYKAACDTDVVTLVLSDPEYEITRILEREALDGSQISGLVLLDKPYTDNTTLYLGAFDTERPGAIFDPWPSNCRSMILIPLMQQGVLVGSLNIASGETERFTVEVSTDFLERLAVIFSICLENSLNHERLKLVGLTDALTGVYNRRYLETRCCEEVSNAQRHQRPLTCMFLDIDKFKRINDTLGHLAGDEVLRCVAQLIKSQLRNNDVMARYGGEEFVILLPRTALKQACEIAERIRYAIATHPIQATPREQIKVTISIGVSLLPEQSADDSKTAAQKLLALADEALYLAKESGRNKVVSDDNLPLSTVAKRGLVKLFSFT